MHTKLISNNVTPSWCLIFSLFLFQSAGAAVKPPYIELDEYRPDVPKISDRRTGEPTCSITALPI